VNLSSFVGCFPPLRPCRPLPPSIDKEAGIAQILPQGSRKFSRFPREIAEVRGLDGDKAGFRVDFDLKCDRR